MVIISNACRVPMRFFMFKYLIISSLFTKSFKFVKGGHLWQFSTKYALVARHKKCVVQY